MSSNLNLCISKFNRFFGRIDFNDMLKIYKNKLDENPVFESITKEGAFTRNIIIIIGGRGCGKTLLIRYLKHYFGKEGWILEYIKADKLKDIVKLKQTIESIEKELNENSNYKVAIAIDDIVEADEVAKEYLRDIILPLALKYEGRVKIILSTQSERVGALQLLKDYVAQMEHAEMFFGEYPDKVIENAFKRSYTVREPVMLFRGASIINLDAYWSRYRSLDKVNELGNIIAKIADFYATNMDAECRDLFSDVRKFKHGLALLALSSLPKKIPNVEGVIIEYGSQVAPDIDNPVTGLNGSGIADLLQKFVGGGAIKEQAKIMEKFYNDELMSIDEVTITPTDVKNVILKSLLEKPRVLSYVEALPKSRVTNLENIRIEESTGQDKRKRRRLGPMIDLIRIKQETQQEMNIIIYDLKIDQSKGGNYILYSSLQKLKNLIYMGVPASNMSRYLVVLAPSKKQISSIYRTIEEAKRQGVDIIVGEDIIIHFIDTLNNIDKIFIYKLNDMLKKRENGLAVNEDLLYIMRKILFGTLLFNLQDHFGVPQLAYFLAPAVPRR